MGCIERMATFPFIPSLLSPLFLKFMKKNERNVFIVLVTILSVFSYKKGVSKDNFMQDYISSLVCESVLYSITTITRLVSFIIESVMYQVATNVKRRVIVIKISSALFQKNNVSYIFVRRGHVK